MSEITTSQTIKIIVGILVVVALIFGLSLYFGVNVFGFFKSINGESNPSYESVDLSGYKGELQGDNQSSEARNQTLDKNTGHAKLNFVPIKLK